jgi:ribosomal protein L37E
MNYMQCTTCKKTVYLNDTGTCLACQRGFAQEVQEDVWKKKPVRVSDVLEPNYQKLCQYPKLEDEI